MHTKLRRALATAPGARGRKLLAASATAHISGSTVEKQGVTGSLRTSQHKSEAGDCTEDRKGHRGARPWRRQKVIELGVIYIIILLQRCVALALRTGGLLARVALGALARARKVAAERQRGCFRANLHRCCSVSYRDTFGERNELPKDGRHRGLPSKSSRALVSAQERGVRPQHAQACLLQRHAPAAHSWQLQALSRRALAGGFQR